MADKLVLGVEQLIGNLKGLQRDISGKDAASIVVAGGRILRAGAKAEAQRLGLRKTGAMINNIVIKRERNAPAGTAQYNLGVRHGRDLGNGKKVIKYLAINKKGRVVTRRANDPWYWRFLELDTKRRKGTSFIGKSAEVNRERAIAAMAKQAQKLVLKGK